MYYVAVPRESICYGKNMFLGHPRSGHWQQVYGTETNKDIDVNSQGQATSQCTQNSDSPTMW